MIDPKTFDHHAPSEEQVVKITALREKGKELFALLAEIGDARETSIAVTKLEESVMWGVKSIIFNAK